MAIKQLVQKQDLEAPGTPSRALSKGVEIIELLSAADSPMQLGAIARQIRLGKPSTFRLLQSLVKSGVVGTSGSGEYHAIRRFTPIQESSWVTELIAAADEEMRRINAELAETVSLAALFEDHIRVVHTIESSREIRMSNYLSRILSPYGSSLGKAIVAHQSTPKLNNLFQVYGVYPLTKKTITEPGSIAEELARIRARGYSSEFEETVEGGCCFGAPVRTKEGVRAAISVSMPIARFSEAVEVRVSETLIAAALKVEKNLTVLHRRSLSASLRLG